MSPPARTRPALPPGALTARALLVVVLLGALATAGFDGPPGWQVVHVGAAVGCCALLLTGRRGSAVGGAGATLVALAAVDPTSGAGLLALAGTALTLRAVRHRGVALGVTAVAGGLALGRSGADGSVATGATTAGLLVVLTAALTLLDRTVTATSRLATSDHTLDPPLVRERARLGGGLVAHVGRTLRAAREDVAAAAAVATSGREPAAPDVVDQLAALAALLEHGTRQLQRLSVEPVAERLEVELRAAREVGRRLGIDVTTSTDEVTDPAVADAAALVLREAVTNVLKHAEATRCVIVVRVTPEATVLAVTNDGVAPDAGSGVGSGQRRWHRALDRLGAHVLAGPIDGQRYRVLVTFPAATAGPAPAGLRALRRWGRRSTPWASGC